MLMLCENATETDRRAEHYAGLMSSETVLTHPTDALEQHRGHGQKVRESETQTVLLIVHELLQAQWSLHVPLHSLLPLRFMRHGYIKV